MGAISTTSFCIQGKVCAADQGECILLTSTLNAHLVVVVLQIKLHLDSG
jgi:hypothetical protein